MNLSKSTIRHEYLVFSVKGADLKAGLGFDGFVVVSQGVKAASDRAKHVYGDIHQDISFGSAGMVGIIALWLRFLKFAVFLQLDQFVGRSSSGTSSL